ncbi:MAG: M14 family metallopeptidase [Gemmatimonadota bacterium]
MSRSRRARLPHVLLSLLGILLAPVLVSAQGADVPTPEAYFGFRMGTDNRLARWDRMVEYYRMLGEASDRMTVWEMGPTTLGNPFLALIVTAPANHARLDEYQRMNALLSDPRGASERQIEDAIATGKAVIVQSLCLHSTEVAAGQTAVELAYDLVTRDDDEMQRILDETIGIMIPCFNPDGQIMVADWVERTTGTEYEGTGLPFLYHHYIGHDNNRDAFMQNTVESRYGAQILFREWIPQAYVDHHQMGGYTARIYLPPYAEPIRPAGDPLVWREMAWYGAHMAYKMDEAGLEGAVNAAIYSGWGHFGFHWITPFHNIAGMLTESASPRMAAPLYVHPEQLGGSRQLPEYEAQTTFPSPWEGGWWRVRDIVDRQKVAYMATLDMAARNRETVLRNAWLKAARQTERGEEGSPAGFVIPAEQHDPLTMQHMVGKLMGQGIEVRRADGGFTHEGRVYGAGTYVVTLAQPKRGVIRWLLGRTFYPQNSYTVDPEGNPIRPYDMSGDVMAEFMGVRVDAVESMPETATTVMTSPPDPNGTVQAGAHGYVLDGELNAAFKAVNLLWNEDAALRRAERDGQGLEAGDFVVPASVSAELARRVAEETGVDFRPLAQDPASVTRPLQRQRVAMYQRYYGGNMDEGWTRWLLEDFEFPYETLMDDELVAGNLNRRYDVIILPDDRPGMMTGEATADRAAEVPEEYRSGFGEAGVRALEAFVENGGTLVTFAGAGALAIDAFDLPVRDIVADVPSRDFWAPGSTLRVRVRNEDPLALGMPEQTQVVFFGASQVYEAEAGAGSADVRRIVSYVDRDVLQSGQLWGEDVIAGKAAMVAVEHGQGEVVLIGFRTQHRAQTHGTFKFLFNALVSRGSAPGEVADGR